MQANHALIQVEQLRLLLGNVGSSVIPAYLLAVLMAVGLGHVGGQETLWLWCLGVIASKTVCYWHARVALRSRAACTISCARRGATHGRRPSG